MAEADAIRRHNKVWVACFGRLTFGINNVAPLPCDGRTRTQRQWAGTGEVAYAQVYVPVVDGLVRALDPGAPPP